MPIDKISPAKCYIRYGIGDFTIYREDGSYQESKGFGEIKDAFPDLTNLPACVVPTSATVSISNLSSDHPGP